MFGINELKMELFWNDIKYSKTDIKMDEITFKIVRNKGLLNKIESLNENGQDLLLIDFPAIKDFKVTALQTFIWWFVVETNNVELWIKDFDINF